MLDIGLGVTSLPVLQNSSWSALIFGMFANGEEGAWYDPSDISTLWQDSAGTTPVTAFGDPVGRVDDKSGNGNHVTQGTSGSRPTYEQAPNPDAIGFDAAVLAGRPELVSDTSVSSGSEVALEADWRAINTDENNTITFSDSGATMVCDGSVSLYLCHEGVVFTTGDWYEATIIAEDVTGAGWKAQAATDEDITSITSDGTYTVQFKATGPYLHIFRRTGGQASTGKFTFVSVNRLLVKNGYGDSTDDWATGVNTTLSATGGRLRIENNGSAYRYAHQIVTTVVGQWYRFKVDAFDGTGGSVLARAGTSLADGSLYDSGSQSGDPSLEGFFKATSTTTHITLYCNSATTTGVYAEYDNIEIDEIPASMLFPCLEFDGTDDYLGPATFTVSRPWHRVSAIQQLSWTNNDRIFGGGADNGGLLYQTNVSPELRIYNTTGAAGVAGAAIDEIVTLTELNDSPSGSLQVNRETAATGNPGSLGCTGITMGANYNGIVPGHYRFYGAIMHDGALTDSEISVAQDYLADKSGTAL